MGKRPLRELVYDAILNKIARRELAPGEPIVAREIANALECALKHNAQKSASHIALAMDESRVAPTDTAPTR